MRSRLLQHLLLSILLISAPGWVPSFAAAAAPSTIEELVRQLGTDPIARFHFRQEKRIKSLKRPIVSEGEMVFERTKGIIWSTTSPRPSEFVITPYGITRMEEGQELTSLESKENPAVEAFTKVFLSLFRGDVTELQQTFELTIYSAPGHASPGNSSPGGESQNSAWTLSLTPKDDRVGHFLTGLRLTGDRSLSTVELDEANGDHATISLSLTGAAPLTPTELRMLSKQ
ncbi:MAG: outer membrane lipoprotein carrier protein LolA [Bdellovibrionota bacterium]